MKDSFTKPQHPLVGSIQRHIVSMNEGRNVDRDTAHLHASEMCKQDWCPRQSWYRMIGTPEEGDQAPWWRLANIFEEGHFIHEKYQTWLWEMGCLEGTWGCRVCHHRWWATSPGVCARCASSFIFYREVPLESDELWLIGHADGIWNDTETEARELLEIKSIGLRTIEIEAPGFYKKYSDHEVDLVGLWKMIKRPFPQHLRQGMLYCYVTGIDKIVFLYEFKANQDFKAFTVRFQPSLIESRITAALSVKNAIETGGTVKRPPWAEDEDNPTCKSCPYRSACWHL